MHLPDYIGISARPEPGSLIFTGAFTYHANYDAASWFVGEVYGRIKDQYPAARLTITGNHADLPLPPAPDITRTGFVPDVRPLIAGSWAAVVPMRQGGGTRLKILEAMALGVPVIATTKGAEGLDAATRPASADCRRPGRVRRCRRSAAARSCPPAIAHRGSRAPGRTAL